MTRRCAWCQDILGEICPHCGSTLIVAAPAAPQIVLGAFHFAQEGRQAPSQLDCDPGDCHVRRVTCLHCLAEFNQGAGGETHGICEPCKAREMAKAAAAAAFPPGADVERVFVDGQEVAP